MFDKDKFLGWRLLVVLSLVAILSVGIAGCTDVVYVDSETGLPMEPPVVEPGYMVQLDPVDFTEVVCSGGVQWALRGYGHGIYSIPLTEGIDETTGVLKYKPCNPMTKAYK